jgi:hypothetical protein
MHGSVRGLDCNVFIYSTERCTSPVKNPVRPSTRLATVGFRPLWLVVLNIVYVLSLVTKPTLTFDVLKFMFFQ